MCQAGRPGKRLQPAKELSPVGNVPEGGKKPKQKKEEKVIEHAVAPIPSCVASGRKASFASFQEPRETKNQTRSNEPVAALQEQGARSEDPAMAETSN